MKLKTIIVEDEEMGQMALISILNRYCADDVEVVGIAANVEEAIRLIKTSNPSLLFLDIKLADADNGAFEILKAIPKKNFSIIFTTGTKQSDKILQALNQYKAIKYLLKPLDIDEVQEGVFLAKNKKTNSKMEESLNNMNEILSSLQARKSNIKIGIPIKGGVQYVWSNEIIMFRANANNCLVYIEESNSVKSTRNLKYFDLNLPDKEFKRVSKSHIVNLYHVERITTEDGGTIFLSQKCTAPLGGSYITGFYSALGRL
ncbi:MAG: LytTR family DNA-binding domain-containing protein [Bacteroidota bacterium]|nr:LytTR family DNA-binding domain-containing protein [Bacteroidota bacterium]